MDLKLRNSKQPGFFLAQPFWTWKGWQVGVYVAVLLLFALSFRDNPMALLAVAVPVLMMALSWWWVKKGVAEKPHEEGVISPDRIGISSGSVTFFSGSEVLVAMERAEVESVEVGRHQITVIGREQNGYPTNIELVASKYVPESWLVLQQVAASLEPASHS